MIAQRRWFRLVASTASLSVVLLAAPALAQRVDLALSESRVRVEAGGPPVSLKLAGRAVAEVRSITVLLGGEPVKDVRAELGPAEKTVRPLRITAGPSARPSPEYRLQADVSGRMVALEAVIVVTAPARITQRPPPARIAQGQPSPAQITQGPPVATIAQGLPDLVITNVVFPAAFTRSDQFVYSFELKNTGTGAASLPANFFLARLFVDGSPVMAFHNSSPRQLGPGESIRVSNGLVAYVWFAAPGSYTLTIVADLDGQIAERNEGNNTASRTVSVAAGSFPDVAFVSAAVVPAAPTTTTPFKVRVVITNQGTLPARMSGRILDSFDCGDPRSFWLFYEDITLQPGASRTFEVNAPSSWYQAGPRTCTILVRAVENEINLANNQGTLSFSVAP